MKDTVCIQRAYDLCTTAHNGQYRKDGITPYCHHPIAVAHLCSTAEEKQVALLHDILEDTPITAEDLYSCNFTTEVIEAIVAITKVAIEPYELYLERLSKNRLATKVKILDMFHNISDNPSEKQKDKYFKGIKFLLGTL